MNLGPHTNFIVIAYAIAAVVVVALIAWVVVDGRAEKRTLEDLEARGVRRAGERNT